MDPHIEHPDLWVDFQNNLAVEIRAALNRLILPRYFGRLVPYSVHETLDLDDTLGNRPGDGGHAQLTETNRIADGSVPPIRSYVPWEAKVPLCRVEIRHTETRRLVTVIEMLSPEKKDPGSDAHQRYLKKRRSRLRSAIHLVEIDLLRDGRRPPLEKPVPTAPYYVMVSRWAHRPAVDVWPIQLRDRLPILPIPLQHPRSDVPVDLGIAVAAVYENGAYGVQIDYGRLPPPPRLSEDDLAWLESLRRDQL
jgi:hypothetical protein